MDTEASMIEVRFRRLGSVAFGLLVLLATLSPGNPVFAQAPGLGHAFSGTVKVDAQDAGIGTVITAHVDGTKYGSCTVTMSGSYGLIVQNDIAEGATIHFYVDGQEADQAFPFHDGWTTTLNLTAAAAPVRYTLRISSTTGGSVIGPGVGNFTYGKGTVVDLLATADTDYLFVQWTGDVSTIGNALAAVTTITMQGDYSITANFEKGSSPFPFPFPCPLSVAAYGTGTAERLDVLREFRDVVLLQSATGSHLVALYYRLGPPVARFFAGSEFVRTLVRELLVDPVIRITEAAQDIWRT
jgi:hypothetical protein